MNYDERKKIHEKYDIDSLLPTNQAVKYWTYDALSCYARCCSCTGCEIQLLLETQCRLFHTVSIMIDKLGTPTREACEKVGFDYGRLNSWKT